MKSKVYILGHKNPDADSICSAMGYAAFKKAIGQDNYVAARCGNSNARIDKVLEKFGASLPEYVGDVRLRAQNVMKTDFLSVKKDVSCYAAMDIIDRYDLRAIPMLDSDGKLLGELSVFDLGEFFIPRPSEVRQVRQVRATLQDVINTLNAEVHLAFRLDEMEDMFVRVGAMEVNSFGSFIEKEKLRPEQNLIVVGDRFDIQIKAIQMKVRGIIVTGGYKIDSSVMEMAKANGVSIISCPHDSATASLLVRMATRALPLVRKDFAIVKKDYLLSRISSRIRDFYGKLIFVCDEKGKVEGLFTNTDLLDIPKPKLVLVDHNELSQAVVGAEEAEILEIIDHHRVGATITSNPILFMNKPVGSTCTIISQFFAKANIVPDKQISGILLGGIICDTLNLKSPTSTLEDAEEISRLSKIYGESPDSLAEYFFSSNSVLLSQSAEKTILSDCKHYEDSSYAYSISQIEELGFNNIYSKLSEVSAALESYRASKNFIFSALLVTNVVSQDSLLIICGNEEFISKITYNKDSDRNFYELPGIVSRKKQLVPYLSGLLKDFS